MSKEYKILETKELTTMPNPALAKDLLERLVDVTSKVVLKRKWNVGILKEFYPKNHSLLGLNVNAGSAIFIRLRDANDMYSFLPWVSLLGTLVHELTHNEIGEHSAEFYDMMDKVYDEVESINSDFQFYSSNSSTNNHNESKVVQYSFDGKFYKMKNEKSYNNINNNNSIINNNSNKNNNNELIKSLSAKAAIERFELNALKYRKTNNNMRTSIVHNSNHNNNMNNQMQREEYTQGCSLVKWKDNSNVNNIDDDNGIGKVTNISLADNWTCLICAQINRFDHDLVNDLGHILCLWCQSSYGSTLLTDCHNEVNKLKLTNDHSATSGVVVTLHVDTTTTNRSIKNDSVIDLTTESFCYPCSNSTTTDNSKNNCAIIDNTTTSEPISQLSSSESIIIDLTQQNISNKNINSSGSSINVVAIDDDLITFEQCQVTLNEWICNHCTFINTNDYTYTCNMCNLKKSRNI